MSIFKNSKFSKATAYIASAGSLVPMLSKDCSSVKVFAEGNDDGNEGTKKEASSFSNALSKVLLWFIFVKGLFRKGVNYVGSLIKGKGEDEYFLKFGRKLLNKLLNTVHYVYGYSRADGSRIARPDGDLFGYIFTHRNLIDVLDEKTYGNGMKYAARDYFSETLGQIDVLASDDVVFSEDKDGNVVISNRENGDKYTLRDRIGDFMVKFTHKKNMCEVELPLRWIIRANQSSSRANEEREWLSVLKALSLLENETLVRNLIEGFDYRGIGYKHGLLENLEKLVEIFKKKDKTRKLLKKAENSLRMFKFMERFLKNLKGGKNIHGRKLLKKIFDDNVRVAGEDKETLNEFRRLAADYLAKLYSLYSADNLKELNNMSEEVKKELGMDTEGFDFKNNSTGESLFSEN